MQPWLLAVGLALFGQAVSAGEHAAILLYHRVSDAGPDSTRVAPARFAAHLDLIIEGGYQVIPLADLLDGVYGDAVLPERAVAITFDDAYRSVGENAYPLLRERDMPFTVFVATDVVDGGSDTFLSWRAMRAMADDGRATFGPHSRSHAHLESLGSGDSRGHSDQGQGNSIAREVDGSLTRLREQLGHAVIDAFAYPYGEYSRGTEVMLAERGLYGLAQQSGAVGPETPATRIPRFPFYIGGDSDGRLTTALTAQPLPVAGEEYDEVFFKSESMPPLNWRWRPGAGAYRRDALRCYASSGELLKQHWADDELVVSLPVLRPGRNKVNCTAPAESGGGYFWHSRLWLLADGEGNWLLE